MKIAFDAKRAFHNHRGLGNYSRDTIRILSENCPDNEYFLLNPEVKNSIYFAVNQENSKILCPRNPFYKVFSSFWRSYGCVSDIKAMNINIFHGLGQELPFGIHRTKIKTVATVHDTIFMRFPEQYDRFYRNIFIRKNRYIAEKADKIIAISETTKRDFIHFFNADPVLIDIVYQGCNNIYRIKPDEKKLAEVKERYKLPVNYILTVGAIEPRKNIETILKAIKVGKISLPLVVVGRQTGYLSRIMNLIHELELDRQVIFLHRVPVEDLPAVYKMASVFVYPSMFEGFGIPVLEALCVGVPVITSKGGVFRETGGNACLYVDYDNAEEMSSSMEIILNNNDLRNRMIEDGFTHSALFTDENIAANLLKVYNSII